MIALVAVAGTTAAYMLALNIAIKTHLVRAAMSYDPAQIRLEYRSAYAYLPWRIHVDDLVLRGRDSAVEWILLVDRCDFDVSVLALLKRKFHASHVLGQGVSFRLRLEESEPRPTHDAHVPPIPGFADPALRDIGPMRSHEGAEYNLWEIRLDDVTADGVREVWFDTTRVTGNMRIQGSWLFRPLRWLDLGHPLRISTRGGGVALGGGAPYLRGVNGALALTIHPFDVRVPQGLDVLHEVSLQGAIAGSASLGDARAVLAVEGLDLEGDAAWSLGLNVERGVLEPSTALSVDLPTVKVVAEGVDVSTSMRVSASVHPEPAPPVLRALVSASGLVVERRHAVLGGIRAARASAESRELDLARPLGDLEGALDFEDAQAADLAAWSDLVPREVRLEAGLLVASGHLEGGPPPRGSEGLSLARRTIDGSIQIAGRGVAGRVDTVKARGDLEAHVDLRRLSLDDGAFDVAGSRLRLSGLRLDVDGAASVRASVPVVDVRALALETRRSGGLQGRLQIDLPSSELTPPGERLLTVSSSGSLSLSVGGVTVRGHAVVDFPTLQVDGTLDARATDAHATMGGRSIGGQLFLHFESTRNALRPGLDVSRSTLALVDPARGDRPWHLDASLADAHVMAEEPLIAGMVHLTTNDGAPLLEMITTSTPVPAWLADALVHGPARADARVLFGHDRVEVRDLHAAQGALEAEAELVRSGPSTRGAALLHVGPVTAAIGLGEPGGFVLFGAESWYRARVGLPWARP